MGYNYLQSQFYALRIQINPYFDNNRSVITLLAVLKVTVNYSRVAPGVEPLTDGESR